MRGPGTRRAAVPTLLAFLLLAACGADGPPERPAPEQPAPERRVVGLAEAEAFALDPPL